MSIAMAADGKQEKHDGLYLFSVITIVSGRALGALNAICLLFLEQGMIMTEGYIP